MGWQDDPIASPASSGWQADPIAHAPVRSFDVVNGETVPSGSSAAVAARSPITQVDPNDPHPVTGELGAMLENIRAGAGKYFADLGRGIGQKVGLVNHQDVKDSRALDAPLMATTSGKVGNIGAGVLTTVPAMAIPGANTVTGAGLIGAATGALQPAASTREALINPLIGGAIGAGAQYAGQKIGQYASDRLAARATQQAEDTTANSARDAVLKEGRDAGLVISPTDVNPSATATALESISGKAATPQGARVVNAKIVDSLTAKDLGLPQNIPPTRESILGAIKKAGDGYAAVKNTGVINAGQDSNYLNDLVKIGNVPADVAKEFPGATAPAADQIDKLVQSLTQDKFSAASAVEYGKRLRQQASQNFSYAARTADPEKLALAQAQSQGAKALENMIGRHLEDIGKPELYSQWLASRQTIAKGYQALSALDNGHIDATVLSNQLQRGEPVTGGMGLAARFAEHFPRAMKPAQGGVGVSKLAATVSGSGVLAGALTGNVPLVVGSLAGSAAPYAVRQGLLSGIGQRVLATPNYAPNALGTLALRGMQQAPNVALPLGLQAPRLAQGNQ